MSSSETKCLLCNDAITSESVCIADFPFLRSKSSNATLMELLQQVIGRDVSISSSKFLCSTCCDALNKIDGFNTSAKQLQQQLLVRFEELRSATDDYSVSLKTTRQSVAPLSEPTVITTMEVSPSLSVTVMKGVMTKKRLYGIPEHEYFSSSNPKRKHCCDMFCTHLDLPYTKPRQQLLDVTNHDTPAEKNDYSVPQSPRTYKPRAIKCTVGDLDKSHIASLLNTPTRRAPSVVPDNSTFPSFYSNSSNISPEPQQPDIYDGRIRPNATHNLEYSSLVSRNKNDRSNTVTTNNGKARLPPQTHAQEEPVQLVCALPDTEDDNSSDSDEDNTDSSESERAQTPTVPGETGNVSAAAMILNNPVASSLLQSFLATSLWLQGAATPHTTPPPACPTLEHDNDLHDFDVTQETVTEDVTCESLSLSCSAVQDKNTRQELKNTGQSYVNTKGKMVEAKRVAPQDCSKCVMRCSAKLSEGDRQSVFAEFWGLADYNLQREYLAEHMHREEKLGPSGLTRTIVLYYLTHHKKVQVCRQFFLKTLDVSEKASRIVLEKKIRGEFGNIGAPPPAPTHRTTSSRSRRTVANNQDSDYEY